jgi:ATP-dependent Lhr-like helicase
MSHPSLRSFHPAVTCWFTDTFGEPTPPQAQGWPIIADGKNVLLLAPTGSGKTLAAFLKCLDTLYQGVTAGKDLEPGVQVLYVSPLKALNNDIYRNLEVPLAGIEETGRQMGFDLPYLKTAIRTGDTPGSERQKMLRRPPQILITTPESLFLLLSSQARHMLRTVRFVIVDEIHTLFPTKRGAHLALSLERLEHLLGPNRSCQRIGLSATMRPLDQVAAYLAGKEHTENGIWRTRPVTIVDTGQRKSLDLKIVLPVPDLRELPEKSIWPSIYKQLLAMIKEHRTTLIFVNNRRLAERITANINDLAGKELAKTHHGSVSKEVRLQVETMLKKGEIACIVATASLELGIDIGHIDLVIQIESPKEVARGLQRVGRAGHVVGMPSKGRIIPKTRSDLLETAAILREMKAGNVEPAKAISNCLDVLAQQLVAMTTEGDWQFEEAVQVVRSAYNFNSLSDFDFQNVLAMLAGSFETKEFVDLRPRLYWDRNLGVIKPDPYGKRLVYSSGGTIPDRGYYGVYLQGSNLRLGELDEEFVYERRLHERFVLGTSIWRIEELRQDRVVVSPSKKGGEAIVPFWKADPGGRSYELGKQIGVFYAQIEQHLSSGDLSRWLESDCELTPEVIRNLSQYVTDQKNSLGYLQTDRRLVVEEFHDEIGEWRVLIHSPFGMRLHLALGLIIKDAWEKKLQINVEVVPSDDGIMFHLQGGETPPEISWYELAGADMEPKVAELISESALFGITFRQAAQLSLIMPRTGFGRKRNPFWLSRLKAGNLLQVVAKYRDFPLIVETYRAILNDYFDLAGLRKVLQEIQQGKIHIHKCRRQTPSPFASSHLFNFIGNFMYEGEAPRSELRLQMFGLGRETLKVLVGKPGLRNLLDPDILKTVETKARGVAFAHGYLTVDLTEQWLEKVGDVLLSELQQLFPDTRHQQVATFLQELIKLGKAVAIPVALNKELVVSRRQAPVYLQGLPDIPPELKKKLSERLDLSEYLPEVISQDGVSAGEARRSIIQRYVRSHGPFRISDIVNRYGFSKQEIGAELTVMAAENIVEAGEFIPGGTGEEWCDIGLLQEIHRRSLARARREVEAREPHEYGAFLARWQGIGSERTGLDGIGATFDQLCDLWLPAAIWENSVLPNRVKDFCPSQLEQLIASGQFFWRARGNDHQLQICFQKLAPVLEKDEANTAETMPDNHSLTEKLSALSANAQMIRKLLQENGAMALPRILQQVKLSTVTAWQALEELILAGLITNDTLGPIRYLLHSRPQDRMGVRGVLSSSVIAQMGRWSLLPPAGPINLENQALTFINRYGLICREPVQQESGAWGELYPCYDLWEQIGKVRRGYFCKGLSGIQYALPSAVEQLRLAPTENLPEFWVLHRDDPANPLKIFPEWPDLTGELKPEGEYIVFQSGEPVLAAGGKKIRLQQFKANTDTMVIEKAFQKLIPIFDGAYPGQKIVITRFNGEPIIETEMADLLKKYGFEKNYLDMVLWPSSRK